MREEATIYAFARMCGSFDENCEGCPLCCKGCYIGGDTSIKKLDQINKAVLNWCKERPNKTRQDKFLELFPTANAKTEFIDICPRTLNRDYACNNKYGYSGFDCNGCKKSYWLAEAEK